MMKTRISAELIMIEGSRVLGRADITAAQLWYILEQGYSYLTLGKDEKTDIAASSYGGFPQISGLEVKYDISAPAGGRIEYILVNDKPVAHNDSQTVLSVCAPAELFEGEYGYPVTEYESLDLGQADALEQYVRAAGVLSVPKDAGKRVKTIGSYDKPLVSRATIFIISFVGCIIAFSLSRIKKAYRDHADNNALDSSKI